MSAADAYTGTPAYERGLAAARAELEAARAARPPRRCRAGCGRQVSVLGQWCTAEECIRRRCAQGPTRG